MGPSDVLNGTDSYDFQFSYYFIPVFFHKKREAGGRATGGVNAVESSPKTKRSMAVIPVSELALQILCDMLAEETEGTSKPNGAD